MVRREEDGIRRYVHLGTGNYNDATAKLYTDVGMLTCAERIGEDATAVFNMLSGYSEPLFWNKLALAPLWLKDKFLHLIEREKNYALEGKNAHIIAKMNSLCDKDIIRALYEASAAGRWESPVSARISVSAPSSVISWSTAAFSILQMMIIMRSTVEVPTGCPVIWSVVWRSSSR